MSKRTKIERWELWPSGSDVGGAAAPGNSIIATSDSMVQAEYVVMSLHGELTEQRVLAAGASIELTDGGAGGNATLALATPGTLAHDSANAAAAPHTHQVAASSNPGASESLLKSDASGYLRLMSLGIQTAPGTDGIVQLADDGEVGLGGGAGRLLFQFGDSPDGEGDDFVSVVGASFAVDGDTLSVSMEHNAVWLNSGAPDGSAPFKTAGVARLAYADDPIIYADIYSNSGGNLMLKPTGDIYTDPDGLDVLPERPYEVNIGSPFRKYLSLHVAELWVETLVAQDVISTIGGRIFVGPTTVLTRDITPSTTTIYVEHNQMVAGDTVHLEARGKVEWMYVTSGPSETPELVSNGGFESVGSWTYSSGDGTAGRSTVYKYAGTYSGICTSGPSANTYIRGDFSVTEGEQYTLRFRYADSGVAGGRFKVYNVSGSGDITSIETLPVVGNGEFVKCQIQFTAPAGCSTARLYFYGPEEDGETAYFDAVSVRVWEPFHLLANNSFASGLTSWAQSDGDGTAHYTSSRYHSSPYSAYLTAGTNRNTYIYQAESVTAGVHYRLGFWFSDNGAPVRFRVYDVTNAADIIALKEVGTTLNNSSFDYYEARFLVPSGCSQVRVYFYCPNTASKTAYVDSVELRKAEFTYTVTRNRDGSGANFWYAGDAVRNTGQASDGWIDLYAMQGIDGNGWGPTVAGEIRNSSTYNDWSDAFALGNLNGRYDFGGDVYGLAVGRYANGYNWASFDPYGGIRFMHRSGDENHTTGYWKPNGDVLIGEVADGNANLFWDQSEGVLYFRGGTDGEEANIVIDGDGAIVIDCSTNEEMLQFTHTLWDDLNTKIFANSDGEWGQLSLGSSYNKVGYMNWAGAFYRVDDDSKAIVHQYAEGMNGNYQVCVAFGNSLSDIYTDLPSATGIGMSIGDNAPLCNYQEVWSITGSRTGVTQNLHGSYVADNPPSGWGGFAINMDEASGGWSKQFGFWDGSSTLRFAYGAYGGATALNYGWLGEAYDDSFMRFYDGGRTVIGNAAPNANDMPSGYPALMIHQGGGTGQALMFHQTNVGHGMMNVIDSATCWGAIEQIIDNDGGLRLVGMSEHSWGAALGGYAGIAVSTTAATSQGGVALYAAKKDGATGNATDYGANENVAVIRNNDDTIAIWKGDGDLYLSGNVGGGAWDQYDDLSLLTGLRAAMVPTLQERWGDFIREAKPILEGERIATFNDDGSVWYSVRGLQMLTIDALRQFAEHTLTRLERAERALEVAGLLEA